MLIFGRFLAEHLADRMIPTDLLSWLMNVRSSSTNTPATRLISGLFSLGFDIPRKEDSLFS